MEETETPNLELEREIQHFLHQCPLTLAENHYFIFDCNACLQNCSHSLVYHCEKCKFYLHTKCALLSLAEPVNDNQIQHFSHWHPITLMDKQDGGDCCKACGKLCCSTTYGCSQCNFFLHEVCLDIPRQIQHYFHPDHPLVLRTEPVYTCEACNKQCSGLVFKCRECCWFTMEVECALLSFMKPDSQQQIQHRSHGHPLTLVDKEDNEVSCEGCGKLCNKSSYYQCFRCNFYLHKSCAELPQQIQHFFHSCPLSLEIGNWEFQCHACNQQRRGFTYRCSEWSCYKWTCVCLDVECALLPTIRSEGEDQIEFVCHGHPLVYCELKKGEETCCSACQQEGLSDSIYGCNRCEFYVHKSCVERPQEIWHPFHPLHPLTFNKFRRSCDVCYSNNNLFTYECKECRFHICLNCSLMTTSIKYDAHEHLLSFFPKTERRRICDLCSLPCKESYLRCVKCCFDLHLHCHPSLPQTIEDKCHIHPLTLQFPCDREVDDVDVDDVNDDCNVLPFALEFPSDHEGVDDTEDDDEYRCAACEKQRNKLEPFYSCKECEFSCHATCVSSKVLLSLEEEIKECEQSTLF